MDRLIGVVLRWGVLLASAIILLGGVIYLHQHGGQRPDYHGFHGEPEVLRSLHGIAHRALSLDGAGLIQLGVLLLIATPVARVALSILAFARTKDWTFVIITSVVLAILLYGLLRPLP